MLRGEPKGQASSVPTGRPSSPLSSLSEDQDPGRGRTARPTPGAHSPSPAFQRSWAARAARACSAARSVLHSEFLGEGHDHNARTLDIGRAERACSSIVPPAQSRASFAYSLSGRLGRTRPHTGTRSPSAQLLTLVRQPPRQVPFVSGHGQSTAALIGSSPTTLTFPVLHCRIRLLLSGSNDRFCRTRTLRFITVIRDPWGEFF
jgi:hypothetical protein